MAEWQPARFAPSQHNDLLSQYQDLGFQCCPRSKQIGDSSKIILQRANIL